MKLISCGNSDKYILIPIFGGIIKLIHNFLYDLNPKEELEENPLLRSIYVSIGMIFCIIPFFILKSRINNNRSLKYNKKDENSEDSEITSKKSIQLIHYDIIREQRNDKLRLILLSSVIDFFQSIIVCSFCLKCVYNLWALDIIIMSIFSYLILKNKIYNHQYLSIIMIIILGFALNIIEYFKKSDDEDKIDPLEILWKFISEVCFCFSIIIVKYNMKKNFCSIYEIGFWHGMVNFILLTLCLFIFNQTKLTIMDFKYPDNFKNYFNNFNKYDLFMAVVIIVTSFINNICIFFACDYFTAFHSLIALIISEFYPYFKIKKTTLNVIGFIIIFIILFILLIFVEILELNFCKLSKNTKKNITKRGQHDSITALDIDISYEPSEIDESDINNPINEKE